MIETAECAAMLAQHAAEELGVVWVERPIADIVAYLEGAGYY